MKKYSIFILAILISISLFGQKGEHYVTQYCDCYIGLDPGNNYHERYLTPFAPTHLEVDDTETLLRINHDIFKNSIDSLNRYNRYYTGFIIFIDGKKHKILHVFADWKPGNNGMKKSDGEWEVNYDLATKKFYDFRQIGG